MRYRAPRWLPGPHAQTIWPAVVAPRERVAYRRERWATPDGDFIDVDFARDEGARDDGTGDEGARDGRACERRARDVRTRDGASPDANARDGRTRDGASPDGDARDARRAAGAALAHPRPLVVLFHGLEGGSSSHYATALMAHTLRRGWRGAIAHFRGCGGELNLAPRAYHSGDSDEIDWILRRFAAEHARGAPLFAVGVSLGGNALAKWLGERGSDAAFVAAAAAVSAPQDLLAGAKSLSRGFNRIYTANFLRTLKRKSLAKLAQHPGLFDRQRMLAARDFFEFDDAVTAPMHGFRSCYDYWERSSSRPFLRAIRVPTLIVNARNDPFLPASALAGPTEVSASVTLDYPDEGGHVGFATGRFPGRFDWLPRRVLDFFAQHLPAVRGGRADAHG